jgi:hypothetical protein
LFEEFFDLFDNNTVKRVVHAGWSDNSKVTMIAVNVIPCDHEAATLNLFDDVFFPDISLYRSVDFQCIEKVDEAIVFFEEFNHLAGTDGVGKKFRLAQNVAKTEVKSSTVIRDGCK